MTNKTTILGNKVSFHCHVSSGSVTYVRWYVKRYAVKGSTFSNSTQATVTEIRSIVPVKVSSFVGNGLNGHLFSGESVFLVKNASLHDEGEYICEAFNEHGRVRWGAFLVVVKGDFFFLIFCNVMSLTICDIMSVTVTYMSRRALVSSRASVDRG